MIAVTYTIHLEEPLLATSLDGDPNSAISFDYISGSLIRGAIAGQLAEQDGDIASTQRDLIFNGAVRFLNAYPALGEEPQRSLPVPASWKVEKLKAGQDDAKVQDFALLSETQRAVMGATKDLSGFTLGADVDPRRYHPNRQIAVHTLRDRNAGRSTQALGTIYRYDALAGGEVFCGAVVTETKAQAEKIQQMLRTGSQSLGGAQGGGYGKVRIDDVQINETWSEVPGQIHSIAAHTFFRLTLLSHTILKDENGIVTADIASALPFPAEEVTTYSKVTYVGGFNRKWGLPLPQDQALKAGSVFILKANREISVDEVERLLDLGIGQRRAEGFGRVAINWGTEAEFPSSEILHIIRQSAGKVEGREPIALTVDSAHLAQRMEERLWRRQLDRALIMAIQKCKPQGTISNSQLSRLRIIARSALTETRSAKDKQPSLTRLVTLFTDEKNGLRPTALKKYNKVRIAGKRLPDWIVELAQKPTEVWQILAAPPRKLLTSTEDKQHPEALTLEYTVRLIDGVLAAGMKEK